MKIEIDQSGKVEKTSVPTVLADSLGNSILIRSTSKQLIQAMYREKRMPNIYVYDIFSALISFLIAKSYKTGACYVIDREYYGHENLLRGLVMKYLLKQGIRVDSNQIQFALVGKHSTAHTVAYARFTSIRKHEDVRIEDIIRILV